MSTEIDDAFRALTGYPPFPWQSSLYSRFLKGEIPASCTLPTGLGKTSVIAIWLLALSRGAPLPRRLVYVVNRRTVVDQTSEEVRRLRMNLDNAGISQALAVSTLRGQMADNRAWSEDPSRPAVICGTVDMIGSRLLFSGYRIGFKTRPLHAGFLGQDALLVHDEAHLEPAFQCLLDTITKEQNRCRDGWPLRVMELTATPRSSAEAFSLSADDLKHPEITKRIRARKALTLQAHGPKDLVDKVVACALKYRDSARAILIFLRTVDDVSTTVAQLRKAGASVQQLTGTMRGYERDRLVDEDPIFRRFLSRSDRAKTTGDAVYLVCTSAGEVGVNLSADDLICDLSTFESMAQRFGRVNRFGERSDTEVHVIHPFLEDLDPTDEMDAPRIATLALLEALNGDASPEALDHLDMGARKAAFSPPPKIVDATEILFDAWALTTLRGNVPGRPPVAPYLHGITEWEPATTQVAWREEVSRVVGQLKEIYSPQDLLEDFPLKPHELLADRTTRIFEALSDLAAKLKAPTPVWIVDESGAVDATRYLTDIVSEGRDEAVSLLGGRILVLPALACQPVTGLLSPDGVLEAGATSADVADQWLGEGGAQQRARVLDDESVPPGMRLVRRLRLSETNIEDDSDDDTEARRPQQWSWYELPHGADDEGSRSAALPVLLSVHCSDVEREATRIVETLTLPPGIKRAIVLAAKLHDIGKERTVWQRGIGNLDRSRVLAKAGGRMRPLEISSYRHELGSIIDAKRDGLLDSLEPQERELALHLVAAHHGRARPHFPTAELLDPGAVGVDLGALGTEVALRFAELQRRFGRWGLAYLESILRAADYAASASPSAVVEVVR